MAYEPESSCLRTGSAAFPSSPPPTLHFLSECEGERVLEPIVATGLSEVAMLVVQAVIAVTAISSVVYVVRSDRRHRRRATLSVSIEGDARVHFVLANFGPADAKQVSVALQSENERFADAGRDWERDKHLPIERLGPGGHYVLLLPRRIPQTDPRFRVTLTWHDPHSERWRLSRLLRRRPEPNCTTYDLTQLGPGGPSIAEVRHQARMQAIWTR